MSDRFVNLHAHTSTGSLLDSLLKYTELVDRTKELGQSAVALTDHGAVSAIYQTYNYAKKQGIKLIPGNEVYFRHDLNDKEERGNKHLVLLAQNATGWSNILRLNFLGWQNQKTIFMKQYPVISFEHLEKHSEGIIALSACSSGILSRHIMNGEEERLHTDLMRLKNIFDDNFFLEIQPHALKTENGKVDQVKVNCKLVELAHEYGIKLVSTFDCHYKDRADAKMHDLMLAIRDKVPVSADDRYRYSVSEFYPKTSNDIVGFFGPKLGLEVIKNTQAISQRCEPATYLEATEPKLPSFTVSDVEDYAEFKSWKEQNIKNGVGEDAAYLRYKTITAFHRKYDHLMPEQIDEYWQRLKSEVSTIEEKQFSSYMLIVADYVDWAEKNGVLCGPGRGSIGGSLVAHLLGISKVDPIKHNLLFARFLNKYKKSFPDADLDFSLPDKVNNYVKKKYGEKRVARISNVMVMTPKVVVKDVARSLEVGKKEGMSPEQVKSNSFKIANNITKALPDVAETIEEATKISKDFARFMSQYPDIESGCKRLENIERQNGVHAAGVIISNEDLDGIAPLRIDKDGDLVMSWDKDLCEENGFIKFDFLILKTLNVVAETFAAVEKRHGKKITLETMPLDDQDVFKMISKGDVSCVFQLESTAVPMCKAVKPKSIDDIAVITSLIRPAVSPEQRRSYLDARFGRKKVELIHEKMANCVKDTHGELLFEEQLMTLAKDIAGWELDRADNLRKITKLKEKGRDLLKKTGLEFVEDTIKNGIERKTALQIWDIVSGWNGYGFNRAHATAYSYISYYTAYLKYHYPTEFMCAIINSEDQNSSKVREYKQVAKDMGIEIINPNIRDSGLNYQVITDKKIATGLLAIKGVGEPPIEYIIANRPYKSFAEFIFKSTGTSEHRSPINKTVIEHFAKAGCFDVLGITRKNILEHWQTIKSKVQAAIKKAHKNGTTVDLDQIVVEFDANDEYKKDQILKYEMEVMGQYLSGTYNDIYGGFFKNGPDITSLNKIGTLQPDQLIKVEAIVKAKIKEFKISKKNRNYGRVFAKYLIEDTDGHKAELTLWPDHYDKFRQAFDKGVPIRALCKVNDYMDTRSLVLHHIEGMPINY